MNFIRKCFRYQNIGIFLFLFLNLNLILYLFTSGYQDSDAVLALSAIYVVIILIAMSPIGEWFICLMIGAKEIKRKDMKLKIVPLLEVVYNRAFQKNPEMVRKIHLKIIYDDVPNAYAVGRRTICITSSLLRLSDECILGILAHEVGHIVHKDSELQAIIAGSNIFITVALLFIRLIYLLVTFIISLAAIKSRNTIVAVITAIIGFISSFLLYLWSKVCLLFLRASLRANEYDADLYAYQIGFGYHLAHALDVISNENEVENSFLKALYSTHPNHHNRIARLQDLGVEYAMNF